jgi:DNA polymerase IV
MMCIGDQSDEKRPVVTYSLHPRDTSMDPTIGPKERVTKGHLTGNDRHSISSSSTASTPQEFNFNGYPPMYIATLRVSEDERRELGLKIEARGGKMAFSMREAKIMLTKARGVDRVMYDLKSFKIKLRDPNAKTERQAPVTSLSTRKRKRHIASIFDNVTVAIQQSDTSSTDIDTESVGSQIVDGESVPPELPLSPLTDLTRFKDPNYIRVLKLEWLLDTINFNEIQPMGTYTIFEGLTEDESSHAAQILNRPPTSGGQKQTPTSKDQRESTAKKPNLTSETTSEHEEYISRKQPRWLREGYRFSCQRRTLANGPNDKFLAELRVIKRKRQLDTDEIGVSSYGTAIASIAGYPYRLASPTEVQKLPGCDVKFGQLFREFKDKGSLREADEMRNSERLRALDIFSDIHDIGAKTAMEFWNKGYRELADLVEYNWDGLTRSQQIGLKYRDEFLEKISRSECERIASIVEKHTKQLIGNEAQCLLVGGYRKGKEMCGDVDIVVSHPNEESTLFLIHNLVGSLVEEGWVTHVLKTVETNSHRGQRTNDLKSKHVTAGAGFDTLDKSFVVWQDPAWPTKDADLKVNPKAKNPAKHHRVDIIISPWKTVGCAVLGWSAGITFERDLRKYAKIVKGWKWDSTGARDRKTGQWLDLERFRKAEERAKTMEEAERRVFESFGLDYLEPWERLTD